MQLSQALDSAGLLQQRRQVQSNRRFITFKDLGNRSVAIRREAISEFYFSSEAYDWYGPKEEHKHYNLATPIQMPDTRDWTIAEAIKSTADGCGEQLNDFPKEAVEAVRLAVGVTDEQFSSMLNPSPEVKFDGLSEETNALLDLAGRVTIQLSSGKRREIDYIDCNLFECWEQLEDDDVDREGLIRLPVEGYHRTVFLNPKDIDYISLPTHKLEADCTEGYDDGLIDDKSVRAKRAQIRRVK